MRCMIAIISVVALAAGSAPAQAAGTASTGCAQRSGASFPSAFTDPANLVSGPMSLIGLRGAPYLSPEAVRRFGGVKSPMLVRAGHRVTLSIAPEARAYVRLDYRHTEQAFEDLPHTMRFRSCPAGFRSGSDADGRPVTFWSGFFRVRDAPRCATLRITADGRRRRPRHIGFGRQGCSG